MITIRISVTAQRSTIMYICLCNAITDREIVQAAEQGARSPEDLAQGLGVGLGCGRCKSCAKALLFETVAKLTGSVDKTLPAMQGEAV
jgi:bacterioferritin-associated ferredoxin